ncbi:dihydroorotase [Prevotella sp. oral taxon 299]|uniref:dihydroorotase n=1 Tax=Prevotella sp. oral taxon 299 TaxID=652716 RepID=UPI0001C3F536|nr:dihydroorotase [Prevotella sp. oral taxon 299]EFC71471.1 dihydroorotase, multifunctional complex type [Prevotella sp. oral taxon 299 str. F0039]
MRILIKNGWIVNEGRTFKGSIVIENDCIQSVLEDDLDNTPRGTYDKEVDATGCFVCPGVIDSHVHFREPGLTNKADIASETRAAAFGGVTSFFDMPNTLPQTTAIEALEAKFDIAKEKSLINYSFFFGATNNNADLLKDLDIHRIPGVKLFMGASTGNMLVDQRNALERIFAESPVLIMTHCEDSGIISANMKKAKAEYGDDPDISLHPQIRSEEACYASSSLAVELANQTGARLHVAHLTTEKELSLFGNNPKITAEAVIPHLFFCDKDYASLKALIKCNPAIKKESDRQALRLALTTGKITTIGTDHAPHLLSEKQGGSASAMSGMPMVQFSLSAMLELVDQGVLTIERVVELMCHNPAKLFEINQRGFIRKGYKADIILVQQHSPYTVTEDVIQSKCKWSPLMGHTFNWQVQTTICNGHILYNKGYFDDSYRGEEICFRSSHS